MVVRVSDVFGAGVGSVSQLGQIVDSYFIIWIFTILYNLGRILSRTFIFFNLIRFNIYIYIASD